MDFLLAQKERLEKIYKDLEKDYKEKGTDLTPEHLMYVKSEFLRQLESIEAEIDKTGKTEEVIEYSYKVAQIVIEINRLFWQLSDAGVIKTWQKLPENVMRIARLRENFRGFELFANAAIFTTKKGRIGSLKKLCHATQDAIESINYNIHTINKKGDDHEKQVLKVLEPRFKSVKYEVTKALADFRKQLKLKHYHEGLYDHLM